MDRLAFITQQANWARARTRKLLAGIPESLWYERPAGMGTYVAWQVGHLIISEYYNGIRVVVGSVDAVKRIFPIRDYAITFGMGADATAPGAVEPRPAVLKMQLDQIHEAALNAWTTLSDADLDTPLIPARGEHPIAETRYEALCWNLQHESWHCGQIALIRRALKHPLIFHSLKTPIDG